MSPDRPRTLRRFAVVALGLVGGWAAFAWLVVPALIRSAYREESLGFLNRLITGRDVHPVERYLDSWSALSVRLTIGLVALVAIVGLALALDLPGRVARWSRRFADREAALAPEPPRAKPSGYFLVIVWCGLAAGFWEALYISKKMLLSEWIPVHTASNANSVWMSPLSYAAVLSLLGLLLMAVALLRPSWLSLKRVLFAAAFVALFSTFRSTAGRLELYGAIPLAAGLALVAARLGAVYSESFLRFVRRSLPVGLALILAVAIGIAVAKRLDEQRELSRLPSPPTGEQPNVLLLILDTVRSKSLSLYGYDRPTTPNLERMAERGVVFDRAVAAAPWTLPTHAVIFTGRHHHELTVDWKVPLSDRYPTLAEVLRDRGYGTAGFVANFYYCGPQFGVDRGFVHYAHKPITPAGIIDSGWLGRELYMYAQKVLGNHQNVVRKTAADVNAEFLGWLDTADPERPFHAFLNYFDAHSPYLPPEPWNLRFSDSQPRYWLDVEGAEYTPQELSELTDAYDGSIAYLDDQLGKLFDELEARGVLENTLVIVTSDHGEQFGEHRLMYHSNSLYMPLLHVPLLVSLPRRLPAGIRVEEPVSVRDIAATVMDLLDVPDSPFPGRSMARSWGAGRADEGIADSEESIVLSEITVNRRIPDWMPAAYGPMQSLVVGPLHYIRRGDGSEELYDWIADPDETTDLARTDGGRPHLEELRARVDALLQPSESTDTTSEPFASAGSSSSGSSFSGGGSSSR